MKPSRADNTLYPRLTQEGSPWPPPVKPTPEMDSATRAELIRYWDDQKIEVIREAHYAPDVEQTTANDPTSKPWYEQAADNALKEAMRENPSQYAYKPLDPQVTQDRIKHEQERQANLDYWKRATGIRAAIFTTRDEKERFRIAEACSPAVREQLRMEIFQKRMERLEARDHEKIKREHARSQAEFERRMEQDR